MVHLRIFRISIALFRSSVLFKLYIFIFSFQSFTYFTINQAGFQ